MSKKRNHEYHRLSSNANESKLNQLTDKLEDGQQLFSDEEMTSQLWDRLVGNWVGMHGFEYHQRVTAKPGPDHVEDDKDFIPVFEGELMHVENGMFLNLSRTVDEKGKETIPDFNIARSGTIPHGNSIMILGTPPKFNLGGPVIQDIQSVPRPKDKIGDGEGNYLVPYGAELVIRPEKFKNPALVLRNYNEELKAKDHQIKNTVYFSFDSNNGGDVLNIPFLKRRANVKRMQAFFWLETVAIKKTGQVYDQLQYMQIMDIEFQKTNDNKEFVVWPHVTVNTLVKQ